MKRCSCCHTEKGSDYFSKAKTKDGLQSYCKSCSKIKQEMWRRKAGIKVLRKRTEDELPESKACTRCKEIKGKDCYRIRCGKRGYIYFNPTCIGCDKDYSRENYQKRKNDPVFKEINRVRARKYLQKSADEIKERRKKPEYIKKHASWENKRYHRIKDKVAAKMKVKRQTPEYKEMMRSYREKNRSKIHKQEKVTKKRYSEKHRDGLTDDYIKRLFRNNGLREPTPELIEAKRIQLLIIRKTQKNVNTD